MRTRRFAASCPCKITAQGNIFYGHDFHQLVANACQREQGGSVFACHVQDPELYGVAEFDATGKVLSLKEKTERPKSNYTVTGLNS